MALAPFNRIAAIPTTFIIDPQGVIQDKFVRSRTYNQFRSAIEKAAVKQPAPADEPNSPTLGNASFSWIALFGAVLA